MKTFMMTLVAVLLLSFMPINTQASLGTGKAKVTYVSQKKSKKKSKKKKSKSHSCYMCGDHRYVSYYSSIRRWLCPQCAHECFSGM